MTPGKLIGQRLENEHGVQFEHGEGPSRALYMKHGNLADIFLVRPIYRHRYGNGPMTTRLNWCWKSFRGVEVILHPGQRSRDIARATALTLELDNSSSAYGVALLVGGK